MGLLLGIIQMYAQTNTEIHVFDLQKKRGGWEIINGKNISNNKGYDSQPYFYDDDTLLYASERNGQTEIVAYSFADSTQKYISNTPKGGEYSPQRIPSSKNVSAVRLDTDGKQRFYEYDFNSGNYKELLKNIVVAYPVWYDKHTVVSSIIENDSLALYIHNLKRHTNEFITKQTGRSLHKMPQSNEISYVKKSEKGWEVWALEPKTKKTRKVLAHIPSEDICWLKDGTLLIVYQNYLLKFNPKADQKLHIFHQFKDENINNITRIKTNKDNTKLAIVAETSPRELAQEQLEAYNNRDIEAFLKPYAKDVKVYTFPNTLEYEGIEEMRKRYAPKFEATKDLHCKITSRIVKGNIVIDEELVTANGNQFKAVAIYEITNGKISTVRFVR